MHELLEEECLEKTVKKGKRTLKMYFFLTRFVYDKTPVQIVIDILGGLTCTLLFYVGRFYALSYNRRIDQDDVVAILPTGMNC